MFNQNNPQDMPACRAGDESTTMTTFAVLMQRCGLSQREASELLEVRLDTVKSWSSGRNPARLAIINELRDLHRKIERAGRQLAEMVQHPCDIQRKESGEPVQLEFGLAQSDTEARKLGFPCIGTHAAALGIAIANLPDDVEVEIVPRQLGATMTAIVDLRVTCRPESVMDAESTKAIQYSEKLMSAAIDVVGAAKVELGQDWARDPKIVGLTILCRSISNFRAAMLLVQQHHVMEARALGRCLYENLLWIGALRERGLDFVKGMLKDEAFNQQSLAELTLRLSKKHGADVSSPESLTLRSIIKDIGKTFPETKKLNASKTAAEGAVETAYVEYARLSLDGVHCSVTALGRHLSRERIAENHTELVVSVEARRSDAEILSAILHSCRALMGVAVGANEILGFTTASGQLGAMVTEFENNGWGARAD